MSNLARAMTPEGKYRVTFEVNGQTVTEEWEVKVVNGELSITGNERFTVTIKE